MDEQRSWLTIGVVAFFAGIVANICRPTRRGVVGFAAAGLISVFCGSIAALCSNYTGEQQVVIAAVVGVFSDRVLTGLLNFRFMSQVTNIHVNQSGGQSSIGENTGVNLNDERGGKND
jgi:hypothetical protein